MAVPPNRPEFVVRYLVLFYASALGDALPTIVDPKFYEREEAIAQARAYVAANGGVGVAVVQKVDALYIYTPFLPVSS